MDNPELVSIVPDAEGLYSENDQPNPEQVDLKEQTTMDNTQNFENLSIVISQSETEVSPINGQSTPSEGVLGAEDPPEIEGVTQISPELGESPANEPLSDDDFDNAFL